MKQLFTCAAFLLLFSITAWSADKHRIAVMTLEAKTGVDQGLANTVTDLLNGELVKLQLFTMIDRANMSKIMAEQSFQQQGCTDQACAVKLGNMLNVQKIIVGSVMKLGAQYIISVNFVDVELSQIDLSENITAADENVLMTAVSQLAQKIGSKVNVSGRIVRIGEDGKILCNIGSADNAAVGMIVNLTRIGETLVDEETGEFLGREIINLGKAKITSLSGKMLSTIEVEKGAKPLQVGDKVEMPPISKTEMRETPVTAARQETKPQKKEKPEKTKTDASASGRAILLPAGLGMCVAGLGSGGGGFMRYRAMMKGYEEYRALGPATTPPNFFLGWYNVFTPLQRMKGNLITGGGSLLIGLTVTVVDIAGGAAKKKIAPLGLVSGLCIGGAIYCGTEVFMLHRVLGDASEEFDGLEKDDSVSYKNAENYINTLQRQKMMHIGIGAGSAAVGALTGVLNMVMNKKATAAAFPTRITPVVTFTGNYRGIGVQAAF